MNSLLAKPAHHACSLGLATIMDSTVYSPTTAFSSQYSITRSVMFQSHRYTPTSGSRLANSKDDRTQILEALWNDARFTPAC